MNGFNPLKWDCEKDGCFNKLKRLKFSVFYDCLPGKISFSDVDGIVEVNGYALMLEWKSSCAPLGTGQNIMFARLSKEGKISVMFIVGNAEDMSVSHVSIFYRSKQTPLKESSLEEIKLRIKKWAVLAKEGKL